MTSLVLALIALALSAVPLAMLCIGDPKRLRAARMNGPASTSARQRALVIVACAPGAVTLLAGDTAGFTIWVGACALIGWALALAFAAPPAG